MRLNKYLSDAGVCSRREADRLIEEGRVQINGRPASLGEQIEDGSRVTVDKKPVTPEEKKVLLVFHKPKGIECTASEKVKNNVISYIHYPVRVYYAGRLDKDSEGLLLLTNRGELANQMMKAGNFHEKEYQVEVDAPVTEEFLERMRKGVPVLGTVTRPCKVRRTGERSFQIVLTQGLNRQIRRMCAYLGYEVTRLVRTRIMNISLGDLERGAYREATEAELRELERQAVRNRSFREDYRGGKPVKNAGKYKTPEKKGLKNNRAVRR